MRAWYEEVEGVPLLGILFSCKAKDSIFVCERAGRRGRGVRRAERI